MQVKKTEPNSIFTTRHVSNEVNETDLVVHIGDLSYADGFSAQVSQMYMYYLDNHSRWDHYKGECGIEQCSHNISNCISVYSGLVGLGIPTTYTFGYTYMYSHRETRPEIQYRKRLPIYPMLGVARTPYFD